MAGFYIVRVPGVVRVIFRDTYPHYIGPPTVVESGNMDKAMMFYFEATRSLVYSRKMNKAMMCYLKATRSLV